MMDPWTSRFRGTIFQENKHMQKRTETLAGLVLINGMIWSINFGWEELAILFLAALAGAVAYQGFKESIHAENM